MKFPAYLWQAFLAMHPWRYVTAVLIALGVLVKRKAIGAAIRKARKFGKEKIFSWIAKNLPTQKSTFDKTYKGIFLGFYQFTNPPHEWFFTLDDNGVHHKVPTMRSNLLSGVQHGALIEIDTQVLPGAKVEVIRRVRVVGKKS